MKLFTALVLLSALVLGYLAKRAPEPEAAPPVLVRSDAAPYELSGEVPSGDVVRTFAVEGMCCEGCAKKLCDALLDVDGVEEAAVDSVLGHAMVVVPRELEVARLEEALTFENYTATPLP